MKFQDPVFTGKLIKRYQRFFADFEMDDQTLTAHVPNTGSLKGVLEKGQSCRITKSSNPKRKLAYTLQMLKTPKSWVGINTQWPNKIVHEAYNKYGDQFLNADNIKAEYKTSDKTRLDFALFKNEKLTGFIEVKNVTLAKGDRALFPDCVTLRGRKHLEELMELQKQGYSCEMIYVVQREDCKSFSPCAEYDPEYTKSLIKAHKSGIKISTYRAKLDTEGVELDIEHPLEVVL